MKISVKDLRPNPFRDMKRNPINPAKVEALKASIAATDFWDNLIARPAPFDEGKFELGYGHHRLEALKALKIESVDIPVRNLDDGAMLKMLVHENMEEWGANAAIMQESIRAVVLAYADGSIQLGAIKKDTPKDRIRHAPSFVPGRSLAANERPYTAESVAEFLGWHPQKVKAFLSFLELEESKLVNATAIAGLNPSAVEEIVKNVKPYINEDNDKIAKNVVAGLVEDFKSGELSTSSVKRDRIKTAAAGFAAAAGFKQIADKKKKAPKFPPDQNEAAKTVAYAIRESDPPLWRKAQALAEFAGDMHANARRILANCCRAEGERWIELAKQIEKAGSRA